LVQNLLGGTLHFAVDNLQLTPVRNWSDDSSRYWYFSYVHIAGPEPTNPDYSLFINAFVVAAIVLSAGSVIFVVLKRRRARSK